MPSKTDWINPVKYPPVRHGAYETTYRDDVAFQYWNGEWWGASASSAKQAEFAKNIRTVLLTSQIKWRGLTKPSSK